MEELVIQNLQLCGACLLFIFLMIVVYREVQLYPDDRGRPH